MDSCRYKKGFGEWPLLPFQLPSCEAAVRSEEHTSELQSPCNLVCRLLLEKKKTKSSNMSPSSTALCTAQPTCLPPPLSSPPRRPIYTIALCFSTSTQPPTHTHSIPVSQPSAESACVDQDRTTARKSRRPCAQQKASAIRPCCTWSMA